NITLQGDAATQLNFKWEETYTWKSQVTKYFVVFDTLGASPIFGRPLMRFESAGSGLDTAINLTYGQLDHGLYSVHGHNWGQVTLMWAVKAEIDGTDYDPVNSFRLRLNAGKITSVENPAKKEMQVYPNPANRQIRVDVPEGTYSASIYTLEGKKCWQGQY